MAFPAYPLDGPDDNSPYSRAATLVYEGGLVPRTSNLLSGFLHNAMDPRVSADYILRRCTSPDDKEATRRDLAGMAADWRQIVEAGRAVLKGHLDTLVYLRRVGMADRHHPQKSRFTGLAHDHQMQQPRPPSGNGTATGAASRARLGPVATH
jgi:hypothetical protein